MTTNNLSFYVNEAIHLHEELNAYTLQVSVAGCSNWRLEKLHGLWGDLLREEKCLREDRLSLDSVRKNSFRRLRDFLWVNQRTGDLSDSTVRDSIIARWLRLRDGVFARDPKVSGRFYELAFVRLAGLVEECFENARNDEGFNWRLVEPGINQSFTPFWVKGDGPRNIYLAADNFVTSIVNARHFRDATLGHIDFHLAAENRRKLDEVLDRDVNVVPKDIAWDLLPFDFGQLGRTLDDYVRKARSSS